MQAIKQQRLQQGLRSLDLAKRMQVSPARISVLERDEARGAVTLNMLHKAAAALNCRLEYRLVPETGGTADGTVSKPRLKLRTGAGADGSYYIEPEE